MSTTAKEQVIIKVDCDSDEVRIVGRDGHVSTIKPHRNLNTRRADWWMSDIQALLGEVLNAIDPQAVALCRQDEGRTSDIEEWS